MVSRYFNNNGTFKILDTQTMDNFLFKFKIDDKYYKDGVYSYYVIPEGERPEYTSLKLYGTQELWWLLLLYNKRINPFYDWPFDSVEVDNYVDKEVIRIYGSEYTSAQYNEVYEDFSNMNDENRKIKIPNKTTAQNILKNFINYF